MRLFIIFLSAFWTGCGLTITPMAAPQASSQQKEALGSINGQSIGVMDLAPEARLGLEEAENEYLQRRMHLLWGGFEEAVDGWLLAQAAQKEGLSVTELRVKNLNVGQTQVSDAEARQFYNDNKDRIGAEFEVVADAIKQQLRIQRTQVLERSWLADLRSRADIQYDLPVPDLPRVDIDEGGGPVFGDPKARVTIIEFSDFECPYCVRAKDTLKELMTFYPEGVKLVYRDFPLGQHDRAKPAAEAAQCAHEQGQFWPFHDLLFANPDALKDSDFLVYAKKAGINQKTFTECLASERPAKAVRGHMAAAERYGVSGTPAIFINGMKLIGLLPVPLLRALIDKELAKP